jgi:alkylated DNA repair dioxygenase AlkB
MHTEQDDRIEVVGERPRGFGLIPEFVSACEQARISAWLDTQVTWCWRGLSEKPPAQGFPNKAADTPDWARLLGEKLHKAGIFQKPPNHVYVIRYKTGTGMYPHIDKEEFGDTVAGLTLGSTRILELEPAKARGRMRVLLLPGDLYLLSNEARYKWKHSVPATLSDEFRGRSYQRTDGFSVSWRLRGASINESQPPSSSWFAAWRQVMRRS